MRIDAYSAISSVYNNKGQIRTSSVSKASKSDKLEISQFGKDFQIAKQAVATAPDVREDKIADIKAMMSAGTYNITAEMFADKLVSNL